MCLYFLQLTVKSSNGNRSSSLSLDGNKLTLITGEFCIRTTNSSDWVSANLVSMARQNVINNLSVEDNITITKVSQGHCIGGCSRLLLPDTVTGDLHRNRSLMSHIYIHQKLLRIFSIYTIIFYCHHC